MLVNPELLPINIIIIIILQWRGDAALGPTKGTSAKQALINQRLRDSILNQDNVKSLYNEYTLEDGTMVKINSVIANNHIRSVINDQKRERNREVILNHLLNNYL